MPVSQRVKVAVPLGTRVAGVRLAKYSAKNCPAGQEVGGATANVAVIVTSVVPSVIVRSAVVLPSDQEANGRLFCGVGALIEWVEPAIVVRVNGVGRLVPS